MARFLAICTIFFLKKFSFLFFVLLRYILPSMEREANASSNVCLCFAFFGAFSTTTSVSGFSDLLLFLSNDLFAGNAVVGIVFVFMAFSSFTGNRGCLLLITNYLPQDHIFPPISDFIVNLNLAILILNFF